MSEEHCPFEGVNVRETPKRFRATSWAKLAPLWLKLERAFESYKKRQGWV